MSKIERLKIIWYGMKNRCLKPHHSTYKYYGGRGISICDEWINSYESFKNWAINNGYEIELTLDRKDGKLGYIPSNCQWKTRKEQQANRSDNRRFEFNGQMLTAGEISGITGENYYCVYNKHYKAEKRQNKLNLETMKKAIISIIAIVSIVLISLTSFGKTRDKTILIQSGNKPPLYLNTGDISYLKSICHNTTIVKALNTLTVIKNSDIADNVILIMSNKNKL